MTNTLLKNKATLKVKAITTIIAIVMSVALPQLFHYVGAISGMGTAVGAAFLPMHIPVIIAGLIAGPVVGGVVGALSPLASFAISGMPTAMLLPFMMIELAVYGLVAGLLSKKNMPEICKLLIVQLAGRGVRAIAILIAIYGLNNQAIDISQIWSIVTVGIAGILLQWALIPLFMYRVKGLKKYYE